MPDTLANLERSMLYALYGATRRIAHASTVPQIWRALLESLHEVLGCPVGAMYSYEVQEGERILSLADSLGADSLPRQLLPPADWFAPFGQQCMVELGTDPVLEVVQATAIVGGALGVATAVQGHAQLHAVVMAFWPSLEARPAGWATVLGALAEDAGYALDKVSPLQHGRLTDISDPQALLTAVNAVTDIGLLYNNLLDRLLKAILAQILDVLHMGGGAIFLYDEQAERVDLAIIERGPELHFGQDPTVLWADSLLPHTLAQARETARFGYPSLTVEALAPGHDKQTPLATALEALRVENLVSVPLLAGGWLTGVLQVVAMPGKRIHEGQIQVLRILARQTAVAIEHARLFAQTRTDQERTRAVVDATNDAILMLDADWQPLIVNRRARFFFGLTERDLLGKRFDQLSNTFARIFVEGQRFTSWLGALLRSQDERAVEEFAILNPEPRLLQCFSAPVRDVHERYHGRILVFRDITREREVERMKNDFVAIVSHELRTPLTSMRGTLQLVLGKPGSERALNSEGLPQRTRDLLGIALANTERLIRLINDILDIAKIEQGRIQLHREALKPEELCRSAVAEMSVFAANHGLAVELQLSPGLPAVLADRDRATQILINLLSNAIKFSPTGQRVVLSVRHDGPLVSFTVQDWGYGIAPEQQGRLFQKFQQIDSSATREAGGTGLGLAISKALVEEQGGRIWLESEPTQGSSFSFTLPIVPGSEGVAAQSQVLVAVAVPHRRDELCAAFTAAGWMAHPAANVAEIQTLVQHHEVSLVVLDLPLSEANDVLVRQLRSYPGTAEARFLLLSDTPPAGLPRSVTSLGRAALPAAVIAQAEHIRAERRPLVLVIDDDAHVRPMLVRLLQRHGLRAVNASDGYAGLAAVNTYRPDVVLLDIKMPGLDGFEVLRRLKANPATAAIPVLILTANDLDESAREQGLSLGASAYLEKPIAYERLISAINGVITDGGQREHDSA